MMPVGDQANPAGLVFKMFASLNKVNMCDLSNIANQRNAQPCKY